VIKKLRDKQTHIYTLCINHEDRKIKYTLKKNPLLLISSSLFIFLELEAIIIIAITFWA